MMSVARGARPASSPKDARSPASTPASASLATGRVLGVPAPVLADRSSSTPLAHVVLTRTRFGRYVYAIGGNEEATRLSGVAVRFHKTLVYVLSRG